MNFKQILKWDYTITGFNKEFYKGLLHLNRGRINRSDYFAFTALLMLVSDVLEDTDEPLQGLIFLISVPLAYVMFGLVIRRLHDIGLSGFWAILLLALWVLAEIAQYLGPTRMADHVELLLGFVATLIVVHMGLILWPGQKHENKYGKPYKHTILCTYREN